MLLFIHSHCDGQESVWSVFPASVVEAVFSVGVQMQMQVTNSPHLPSFLHLFPPSIPSLYPLQYDGGRIYSDNSGIDIDGITRI